MAFPLPHLASKCQLCEEKLLLKIKKLQKKGEPCLAASTYDKIVDEYTQRYFGDPIDCRTWTKRWTHFPAAKGFKCWVRGQFAGYVKSKDFEAERVGLPEGMMMR